MTWRIEFTKNAAKQFAKLDKPVKQRIIDFLENRLTSMENPRQLGKALQGPLAEYWSYRVGNYRIMTKLEDTVLLILIVDIDHRKKVYK